MKKYFSLFTVFVLLCSNFLGLVSFWYTSSSNPSDPSTAAASTVVNIPDANLQKRLNELIALTNPPRLATDPINVGQMRALTNLYWPKTIGWKGIQNIEGLQYLFWNQNNQQFYLNSNTIVDLSPISDLTQLTKLIVFLNKVAALPSNNWSNLEELDISRNELAGTSALTHLASLSSLKTLNLSLNKLRDADLQGLLTVKNTLENLNLTANYILDVTLLAQLTKLKILDLSNSRSNPKISNIAPLSTLIDLETFKANTNVLADISVVQHFTKLKHLELSTNRIVDISSLAGLNNLLTLNLGSNQIADISHLAGLHTLTELKLSNNQISDVSSLAGLTNLTTLELDRNKISDLSSLNALLNAMSSWKMGGQSIVSPVTHTAPVFQNPIKWPDGSAVPITEVVGDVINVDSAGNPSLNGWYIKILKTGAGSLNVAWDKNYGVGKVFTGALKVDYNIDPTFPVITILKDIPNKSEQSHKVKIKVEDTNLDASSLKYWYSATSTCDATVTYSDSFTSEVEFTLTDSSKNGKYLCIVAKDDVGNTTYLASAYPINIDTIAPTATISGNPAPSTRTNQKVVLTLIANEEVQDITGWVRDWLDSKKFTKEVASTATETVSFYDIAGNLSSPVSYVVANIDKIGPVFTPAVASSIVSRKGIAITLTDVTAADGVGESWLSGAVEMNTWAINLDPNAPVSGDYVLVYTARDHAGNVSTLNRNIQITDADQLSGEVQRVTPALLNGKTAASVQAVNTAKANADAVYNNPHATQLQIDQAKQALATAIANLQTQPSAPASTSSSSRGGGGARLIMDHCPNGDYSPSYYDRSCGTAPSDANQHPQPVQNNNGDAQGITNPEILSAYEWALKNGITTQSPIVNARLLDPNYKSWARKNAFSVYTKVYRKESCSW